MSRTDHALIKAGSIITTAQCVCGATSEFGHTPQDRQQWFLKHMRTVWAARGQ